MFRVAARISALLLALALAASCATKLASELSPTTVASAAVGAVASPPSSCPPQAAAASKTQSLDLSEVLIQTIAGQCYYQLSYESKTGLTIFHSTQQDQLDVHVSVYIGVKGLSNWKAVGAMGSDGNILGYGKLTLEGFPLGVDVRRQSGEAIHVVGCVCGRKTGTYFALDIGLGSKITPEQRSYYTDNVGSADSRLNQLVQALAQRLSQLRDRK